jgi:hypothetical protein
MPLDNDDIKQLIAILQKGLTDKSDDDTIVQDEPASKKPKRSPKTSKKVKEQKSSNKFDMMFEKNMHKEDVEIDKKLAKHPPSARSREFTPVEVTCRVCGKTEEVNPSLIYDAPNRYKCNKCSRTPG